MQKTSLASFVNHLVTSIYDGRETIRSKTTQWDERNKTIVVSAENCYYAAFKLADPVKEMEYLRHATSSKTYIRNNIITVVSFWQFSQSISVVEPVILIHS